MVVDVKQLLKKLKITHFTTRWPSASKFYPVKVTTFFCSRLSNERFMLIFRSIIASTHASDIRTHILTKAADLFPACSHTESNLGYHVALVIKELITVEPD